MIAHVASLTRWEWFKLRRRWMPWVLLFILIAFTQVFIWGGFFSYKNMEAQGPSITVSQNGRSATLLCSDVLGGNVPSGTSTQTLDDWRGQCQLAEIQQQIRLAAMRAEFTLPGSISGALGIAESFGLILISVLTASNIGTDYGWGTLRSVLVRGTGRWQYLAGKLLLLMLLGGGALVVIAIIALATSALAGALLPASSLPVPHQGWSDAAITFGKAWYALVPFVALAAFMTVFTGSSAAGMAITLSYYFGEQIIVAILLTLFDWFKTVADYLLGRNTTGWMGGAAGGAFGGGGSLGAYPSEWHAFGVLLVYILVLAGFAFWRFRKRDVTGATGT